jgi:predicted RNase H-like nuclease
MLRKDDALRRRVFEVHPEVSFTIMSGEPIFDPKKVKGRIHGPGMRCRKAFLEKHGFAVGSLEANLPCGAALDDFYDACACAWSGARVFEQEERVFPSEPGIDAKGVQVGLIFRSGALHNARMGRPEKSKCQKFDKKTPK